MLARWSEPIYALLRVVVGVLFACHGLAKLFGVLGGRPVPVFSLLGAAGIIETVGGVLIAAGLFTSVAAFIASGEMAFAYFIRHFPRDFWPIQNGGEPAVLFCFVFLFMASRGAGIWSADALLRGAKRSETRDREGPTPGGRAQP